MGVCGVRRRRGDGPGRNVQGRRSRGGGAGRRDVGGRWLPCRRGGASHRCQPSPLAIGGRLARPTGAGGRVGLARRGAVRGPRWMALTRAGLA